MINVTQQESAIVVSVADSNRITVLNAGELKGVLIEQFSKNTNEVDLDLSNIKFMDSTGISVLISGLKTSREFNKRFVLKNVPSEIMALLALMKIDKIIEIE